MLLWSPGRLQQIFSFGNYLQSSWTYSQGYVCNNKPILKWFTFLLWKQTLSLQRLLTAPKLLAVEKGATAVNPHYKQETLPPTPHLLRFFCPPPAFSALLSLSSPARFRQWQFSRMNIPVVIRMNANVGVDGEEEEKTSCSRALRSVKVAPAETTQKNAVRFVESPTKPFDQVISVSSEFLKRHQPFVRRNSTFFGCQYYAETCFSWVSRNHIRLARSEAQLQGAGHNARLAC